MYWTAEFAILAYKNVGLDFPYDGRIVWTEFAILGCLGGVEAVRVFLGKKGNLTAQILPVLISLILTVPGIGYRLV